MSSEIEIDLNPVVGAVLAVVTEPFHAFVARLRDEGRVSEAEVSELYREIQDRVTSDRFVDLVRAKLSNQPPLRQG